MANETDNETEDGGKGKGSKNKLIFMVVPLVLVLGGGGYFFLAGGSDEEVPVAAPEPVEGAVVEIDTLTFNLIGEEQRYARVGFALVLDSTADAAVITNKIPLIRDMAISVMTDFGAEELQTGTGMERLRATLSDGAVGLFPDGEVLRVVLTELLVQ